MWGVGLCVFWSEVVWGVGNRYVWGVGRAFVGSVVWGVPGSRLCGERGCVGSVCVLCGE